MYNGIGLRTTRGSGTSGHVQKNLSLVISRPREDSNFIKKRSNIKTLHQNDPELVKHDYLRKLELELLNYSEELEARGFEGLDLQNALEKKREELASKLNEVPEINLDIKNLNSRQISMLKEEELRIFREAIGLDTQKKKKKYGTNNKLSSLRRLKGKFKNDHLNKEFKGTKYLDQKICSYADDIYFKNLHESDKSSNKKRKCESVDSMLEDMNSSINDTSSESITRISHRKRILKKNKIGRHSKNSSSAKNLAMFSKGFKRENFIYKRSRRSRSPSTVSRYRSLSRSLSP